MKNLYGDALIEEAEKLTTKTQFVEFVKLLVQNMANHPDEWHNNTLEQYIFALSSFLENIDGYYENIGLETDLEKPNWRIFADILLAARVYE